MFELFHAKALTSDKCFLNQHKTSVHNSKEQFDNTQGRSLALTAPLLQEYIGRDVRTLTDAVVEAGLRSQDVVSGEVNNVAGEAELAADGGFWPQQGKSFDLGGRAGSCGGWEDQRNFKSEVP